MTCQKSESIVFNNGRLFLPLKKSISKLVKHKKGKYHFTSTVQNCNKTLKTSVNLGSFSPDTDFYLRWTSQTVLSQLLRIISYIHLRSLNHFWNIFFLLLMLLNWRQVNQSIPRGSRSQQLVPGPKSRVCCDMALILLSSMVRCHISINQHAISFQHQETLKKFTK